MPSRRGSCRLLTPILAVVLIFAPQSRQAATAAPRVVDQETVAIPGVVLLGMSPTGQWLLGEPGTENGPHQLCSYETATLSEVACADLDAAGYGERLSTASVSWSPDETKIAFTEDTFIWSEGDIWTFTLADGTIANLTDDGITGNIAFGDADPAATSDAWPAWSPDGRAIAFAREAHITEEGAEVSIDRIELATGVVSEIVALPEIAFSSFFDGVYWLDDGEIVYEIWDPEQDLRTIWAADSAGGAPHSVATVYGILLDISDQDQALILYDPSSGVLGVFVYGLVDIATGAVIPLKTPDADTTSPPSDILTAFSPDGSALLYSAGDLEAPPTRIDWIDLAGGASGTLADGLDLRVGQQTSLGLTWAANGTVFVPTGQADGMLLQLETGGAASPAATPEATPA